MKLLRELLEKYHAEKHRGIIPVDSVTQATVWHNMYVKAKKKKAKRKQS
jgi:hypothetical protein